MASIVFSNGFTSQLILCPIDILIARKPVNLLDDAAWQASHRTLAINAVAQAEALAVGVEQADRAAPPLSGEPAILDG